MTPAAIAARDRFRILGAFASIYFVWGSTYLATHYVVEHIPPFFMGSLRMLSAGIILYVFARRRGAPAPNRIEWRSAAIAGVMMLGLGNGAVIWSVQMVPSGIVALIVASVPIWMVAADWLRPGGVQPRLGVIAGLAIGIVGITVLIGPSLVNHTGSVDPIGAVALLLGSMSWAIGSLTTRHGARPRSPLLAIAMQMIAAGVFFGLVSVSTGDAMRFSPSALTMRAVVSWLYLVLGGSLLAYTAYVYLLAKVGPAKASTYAYVNPVIAVILGWALANEPLTSRTVAAAAVILVGVALITITSARSTGQTGEHPIPVVNEEAA